VADKRKLKFTLQEANICVLGFSLYIFDSDHNITFSKTYIGPDSLEQLIHHLFKESTRCNNISRSQNEEMVISEADRVRLSSLTTCELCDSPFNKRDRIPHLHHHHLSKRTEYFKVPEESEKRDV